MTRPVSIVASSDCRKCGEPYCVCGDRLRPAQKTRALRAGVTG